MDHESAGVGAVTSSAAPSPDARNEQQCSDGDPRDLLEHLTAAELERLAAAVRPAVRAGFAQAPSVWLLEALEELLAERADA